jgi:hypothetical protein
MLFGCPVYFLGAGVAFVPVDFLAAGFDPAPTISMCVIFTGFAGRLLLLLHAIPPPQGIRAIFFTNSTLASSHWPKMV